MDMLAAHSGRTRPARGAGPLRGGLAALLLPLLLAGCTVFGIRSGTEEPSYETVERLPGGIEIRAYGPRLYAEARVPAEGSARNAAFRKLFRYIAGANRAEEKIAMTIPVATDAPVIGEGAGGAADEAADEVAGETRGETIAMTAPVATAEADGMMTMRFFLPARFSESTAPAPRDPAVSLGTAPAQRMAVLSFSGSTREARVTARKRTLMDALAGDPDWRATGRPVAYFYDPPWTLPFLKRNEVAVPVAARPDGDE